MRITQSIMSRNYTNNLQVSMRELNNLNSKMVTYRQYQRPSENPFNALSALKVKRSIYRMEEASTNLTTADSVLGATDEALKAMKNRLDDAMVLILQGKNGVMSEEDRVITAESLRSIQAEMMRIGNTTFGGKYIFGGAQTTNPPFTLDASGNIMYNGQDVNANDTMDKHDVFIDLGMGMNYDSGALDTNSVFSLYSHGCDILGFGDVDVAAGEPSNNIYTLLGQIAEKFENDEMGSALDELHEMFEKKQKDVLVQWTNVGEQAKMVEFLNERNEQSLLRATERWSSLEAINPEEVITQIKSQEIIYQAALQMGSYMFPSTVLDYMK